MDALWSSELTSSGMPGSATLGDPTAELLLWCANFRTWRANNKDTNYWDKANIDMERVQLGKSETQTAQAWGDFLV